MKVKIKHQIKIRIIRIVDTTMGEVDRYKNYEELLMTDYVDNYEVSVYGAAAMKDNRTEKDYFEVVIADNINN